MVLHTVHVLYVLTLYHPVQCTYVRTYIHTQASCSHMLVYLTKQFAYPDLFHQTSSHTDVCTHMHMQYRFTLFCLCSSSFSNWWFVAHLTDLLHHQKTLEASQIQYVWWTPLLTCDVPTLCTCDVAFVVHVMSIALSVCCYSMYCMYKISVDYTPLKLMAPLKLVRFNRIFLVFCRHGAMQREFLLLEYASSLVNHSRCVFVCVWVWVWVWVWVCVGVHDCMCT